MNQVMRSSILAGFLALLTVASAQSEVKVSRTFSAVPGTKLDTTKLRPAIDTTFRKQPKRPENELIFNWGLPDPNNRLTAGGLTDKIRASLIEGKFPAIGATGWTPPDCDMGVGPNHVVCVVNSSIGFFRKSDGANTFLRTSEDFFKGLGAGSFQFDPKALYDPISKRFFILFLEQDDANKVSKSLIAVSDDSDPNGTWYRYRIESKITSGSTDYWLDYPGFGVSKDYVGFSGNMFGFTGGWLGNQFVVIDKAPLLNGGTATARSIQDQSSASVKLMSSDTTNLFALSVDSSDRLKVQSVDATSAKSVTVTVPPVGQPQGSVPGPSGHNLDALDGRLMNAIYRSGTIVATHAGTLGSDPKLVSRWYDINLNSWPTGSNAPKLTQSGNVAGPAGAYYHMPAVAKNKRNEMALVFTRTTSSIQADLMVTGRKSTDAPGTMGAPVIQSTTPVPYGGAGGYNRWGDYFGMAVDPADDLTFWAYGMVGRSDGNWTTVVFPFKITSYTELLKPVKAAAIDSLPSQGRLQDKVTSKIDLVDGIFSNIDSQVQPGVGLATSLTATYNTGLNGTTIGALQVNAKFTAPTGSTAFYYMWNVQTNKWEQISASPATQSPVKFERIENQASPYVASNGQVKVLVRVVQPSRAGVSPYTLKVDQLSVSVATRL